MANMLRNDPKDCENILLELYSTGKMMYRVMIPIRTRKIMNEDEIIAQSHSQLLGPKIADMGASVALGLNLIS